MPEMFGIMAMSNGYEDEEIRQRVEILPQIGAFGTVFDLHTMMMLDEQLLLLVEQFAAEENSDARRSLVPQIIHRWTGASGPFLNLAALEALTGEIYNGRMDLGVPVILNRGFNRIANAVYAALTAQSHLWHLYEHAIFIEGTEDFPEFDIVPVTYEILTIMAYDQVLGESILVEFVLNMKTLAMLDAVNLQEFRDVLAEENISWGTIIDMIMNSDTIIWGTRGNDTIAAPGNRDLYVFGLGGNDTITITGGGNNRVYPGHGNNVIFGGWGYDTYVIGRGHGFNTITANSNGDNIVRDRLVLTDGIRPDEVYFVRIGNDFRVYIWEREPEPMMMAMSTNIINLMPMELICEETLAEFWAVFDSITNRITFVNFFQTARHRLVDITFDDGTVFPLNDLLALENIIFGTEGNDIINVTTNLNHHVLGLGGNDMITITGWGNNRIYPGHGNNVIFGGWGYDTYIIGRGHGFNTITANSNGDNIVRDRLVLIDGISPDEVFFTRVGNNLRIYIAEAGELENGLPIFEEVTNVVTFVNFFMMQRRQIIDIGFDCGATITRSEMLIRGRFIVGTNGDDVLIVPDSSGHIVYGRVGNDEIRAVHGNNRIYPGRGNNTILGGVGYDTYVIGRGHDFNTITANSNGDNIVRDRLVLTDGIRPDEVFFVRTGNSLEIIITDGAASIFESTNRILFVGFFTTARRQIIDITFDCNTILTLAQIISLVDVLPAAELLPEYDVFFPEIIIDEPIYYFPPHVEDHEGYNEAGDSIYFPDVENKDIE